MPSVISGGSPSQSLPDAASPPDSPPADANPFAWAIQSFRHLRTALLVSVALVTPPISGVSWETSSWMPVIAVALKVAVIVTCPRPVAVAV